MVSRLEPEEIKLFRDLGVHEQGQTDHGLDQVKQISIRCLESLLSPTWYYGEHRSTWGPSSVLLHQNQNQLHSKQLKPHAAADCKAAHKQVTTLC